MSSDRNSQMQATEMRYLRKNEAKTKKERIRNKTISMEFGIIPLKNDRIGTVQMVWVCRQNWG